MIALSTRRWLSEISENFKAEFTLLLKTLVFEELVESTGPQFLSVLKNLEVLELSGLSGVDWSSVDVSLTVAQCGPTLHLLPSSIRMHSIFTDVAQHLNTPLTPLTKD